MRKLNKQKIKWVIKEWEEPKQYNEKTIYYYSDGFTEKDIKNGATKTFIAIAHQLSSSVCYRNR